MSLCTSRPADRSTITSNSSSSTTITPISRRRDHAMRETRQANLKYALAAAIPVLRVSTSR